MKQFDQLDPSIKTLLIIIVSLIFTKKKELQTGKSDLGE